MAVPFPLPSIPLATRPRPSSSGTAGAVAILRPTDEMGERKALSQNGISVPIPPAPHLAPVPRVPRPGAASSSQRWGRRVGQEGEGGRPGCFLSPLFPSLASLGSGLGSPRQWCLKLTDLPCPSCLLEEGVELAGALAQIPSPSSPVLGPQRLGVPGSPACPSSGPQFPKKEEHRESRHLPPSRETLAKSPFSNTQPPS